jgi:hypothetical protein
MGGPSEINRMKEFGRSIATTDGDHRMATRAGPGNPAVGRKLGNERQPFDCWRVW